MDYSRSVIRKLIVEDLSEQEFNDLCFDYFPFVTANFAEGQARGARVRSLIEYAEKHGKIENLLDALAEINPAAYEKHIGLARASDIKAGPCDVLVLAANPTETDALALEREAMVIAERLRSPGTKRELSVVARFATRPDQLSTLLLEHNPIIVHFAGHGTQGGDFIFEGERAEKQIVKADELAKLISVVRGRIECVTLNSCWSAERADELVKSVPCVVGMSAEIDDESARVFASGFYEALAFGRDYSTAVQLGRSKVGILGLPDREVPCFLTDNIQMLDPEVSVSNLSRRATRSTTPWHDALGATPSADERSVPTLKLWYGTNRKLANLSRPHEGYGPERDNKLNYGTCTVRVPKAHRPKGELSSSFWWRLWTGIDDSIRLDRESLDPTDRDPFWTSAREHLSNAPLGERDVLVFVHGFRVKFEDAAVRAAQISADMNFPGLTAFFSWPSRGTLLGYLADGETIKASEPFLTEFLTRTIQESGGERIHLIVHSMGNRAVLQVMENVVRQVRSEHPTAFGQIILAAPDVDIDVFSDHCAIYREASLQTTLYASPRDWAVWASSVVNWFDRAGYHPPIRMFEGIDTVRVDGIDMDWLGHGYVGAAKDVINDIDKAIRFNAKPRQRGLEGRATDAGKTYWEIRG